jgi:cell shape-determining protein MreC
MPRTVNKDTIVNVAKTTAKYKLITDTIKDGLTRLLADQARYRAMITNKISIDDKEGRNGLAATTKQIARQKAAILIDRQENETAFRNGDINKFW